MSITYNGILNEMKAAFYNECGSRVNDFSDIELRFKAVASELYSVAANSDFVLKQAFVQTSTGEYLERHAALRGITRKRSSKAFGVLKFYVSEALVSDAVIPEGTVCSVPDKPFIQFSTDERAVIRAGELFAEVSATAVSGGEEYNVDAQQISVMVNPPEYILGVVNENEFTGGADDESDEALRARVISSYNALSNAINQKSTAELLTSLDEVLDAYVSLGDNGDLNVCIKLRTNSIDADLKEKLDNLLAFAFLSSVPVHYIIAKRSAFSASAAVKITKGQDGAKIRRLVEEKIKAACSAERIGIDISAFEIMTTLYGMEGTELIEVSLNPSSSGVTYCGANEYLKLTDVQVEVYE